MNTPYNFPLIVAHRTLNLLIERQAMLHPVGTVFYVWKRDDRLIVAFDPSAIKLDRVNDGFVHDLSTRLKGRLVTKTNSRGLFLQVGFETPPAPMALEAIPLDLTRQPTPWHLPIGQSATGPLWISLIEGDSFLIGGSRRKGKSGLTHAMIQALLHGGKTQVYGWDGKGGAEYQRYLGHPKFHFMSSADAGLKQLSALLAERLKQVRASGYPNIIMHNGAGQDFIEPIALFVDEIALLDDIIKRDLKQMIELYGAMGLYAVLATNNPTQAAILVKSNLATRICFSVPSFQESLVVLGGKGAESLTNVGRGMIMWDGQLIEFQSFDVKYADVTQEQRQLLAELLSTETAGDQPSENSEQDDQARALIDQGETDAAIVRKVWGVSGGARFYKLVERVKALR